MSTVNKFNPCVVIVLAEPARSPISPPTGAILTKKGYRVTRTTTAKETLAQAQQLHPTMVVLDYSAGRGKYAPLCNDLRQDNPDLSILVISFEGAETEPNLPPNVVVLTPPFTARKVLNRIARMLPQPNCDMLRAGNLVLYIQRRCLRSRGAEHRLTPMQVRLLEVFMRHPHQVLSRRFLIKEVWNTDYVGDTRTLDVHIRWLRQLLEEDPAQPRCITTVRGVGYRFVPSDAFEPAKETEK